MPTDIAAAVRREREAKEQIERTVALLAVWLIVCLINVGLLFVDPALAQTIQLFAKN